MARFDTPTPLGELIQSSLRALDIAVQAVEFRVDATMIQLEVQAELVASNSNALRRFHYFFDVTFTDDGVMTVGEITWPDEFVVFSDGEHGDDGLVIFVPIEIDGADETVIFLEDAYRQGWSIRDTDFVTLADFAINYLLDFRRDESLTFSDISTAWTGVHQWDESVIVSESLVIGGGSQISLSDSFNISEVLIGANSFVFGDSVTLFEFYDFYPAYPVIAEQWIVTDVLVVSEVAATDSRPGAFIPGSALLGSPT